jgi:hypothetical protein
MALLDVSISRKRPLATVASSNPPAKVLRIVSALPPRLTKDDKKATSPQEFLMSNLKSLGVDAKVHSFDNVSGLFVDPTEEEIRAYGFETLDAVRTRNVTKLRSFHKEGRPLKLSNRFGESILHLACRKGFADVTDLLINEANVPLWVKDDFGRTPLHDACWACEPCFELMDLILAKCPDLLFISDARGHTPLSYARRDHWEEWIKYIAKKGESLKPTQLRN